MTETPEQPIGFLLIDKPATWTSFDIVAKLRGITKIRKIGHAGTLDPFATGLLVVAVGKPATKQINQFVGLPKTYRATYMLGATSDTDDRDGKIETKNITEWPDQRTLEKQITKFTGEIQQIPPRYAAIKIGGQKLYQLARRGQEVEVAPRNITIYRYEIIKYKPPYLEVEIDSSSGTYIRALARDLGVALKTGGYVDQLRRHKIGKLSVADAVSIEKINSQNWKSLLIPADKALLLAK